MPYSGRETFDFRLPPITLLALHSTSSLYMATVTHYPSTWRQNPTSTIPSLQERIPTESEVKVEVIRVTTLQWELAWRSSNAEFELGFRDARRDRSSDARTNPDQGLSHCYPVSELGSWLNRL